jgi:hypothetical protein
VGIIPCMDSLVIYQRPQTPQRNGRRGEYGQSDGYIGKTVNPSEGVLELCERLDKRLEAVLDRTAPTVNRVGIIEVHCVFGDKLVVPGGGAY